MEPIYIVVAVLIVILAIVLAKLFSGKKGDTKKVLGAEAASKPPSTPSPRNSIWKEAGRLVAQDRKIDAIKLMRDKSGLGLKEAKDAVELMEKLPSSAPPPSSLMATIRHAQETSDAVQRLVANGQKIEAIKLIREQTALGLREAKDLVDRLG